MHDLNRLIKTEGAGNDLFLCMETHDLTGSDDAQHRPEDFPEHFALEGERLPLQYACRPGCEEDGVTLSLPHGKIHQLPLESLDWLVPGLLCEKIEALLRGLPGRKRKRLVPIPETARMIVEDLDPAGATLTEALAEYIARRHGFEIDPSEWPVESVPDHLKMRVLVTDEDGSALLSTP